LPQVETVTATTIEVHQEPNGIIEIVEEERTTQAMVNGHVNGITAEQPAVEPQPPLYDMDLERMHTELYRGRYLTPQDFLDDVGKIVHNAAVRAGEDPERLYKAQAMFTAAQVSIHEFDPQLRMECERMAVRERKRREEHKKSKGKGKAQDDGAQNGNPLAPGARRSARNNGQQPELPITDPVKLERRLKRQRSNEAAADSVGSEEENGEGRDAKRSKMSVSDDDDRDPLDIMGPTPNSPPQPLGVRFAPDIEPMQSLEEMSLLNGPNSEPEHMSVDSAPRRTSGFDAFLLNPIMPPNFPIPLDSSANGVNGEVSSSSTSYTNLLDPFLSQPMQIFGQPSSNNLSPPRTPIRTPASVEPEKPPSPIPMVIERSPTPLPDFHVDDRLLSQLRSRLRENTSSLTIEQLEQLRATSLGCVWHHRSEWDRDELLQELQKIVDDFVDEVATDDAECNSPGDVY